MMKHSFSFGGIDMRKTYGITVSETYDVLFPQLRERKITIPGRDGSYDYGARSYEERIISFDCAIVRPMTRAQVREAAYALSKKSRIEIWNEPDKYYVGRIYNAEALERAGTTQKQFTLEFVCEPFAYGKDLMPAVKTGQNFVDYRGTAQTPALIILKNTGKTTIQTVRISAVYKR